MTAKKKIFMASFIFVAVILLIALGKMRAFGEPKLTEMDDYFIAHGQEETGGNNIVTAIVFDYRGYDTLGESTILFAAVLGVSVLLEWGKDDN